MPSRLWTSLAVAALLVMAACSGAGGGPSAPDTGPSISGRVVDQFSGAALGGLVVTIAGRLATTDAGGRFTVEGVNPTSTPMVRVSGAAIHERQTFLTESHPVIAVVPRSFDMDAFDDLARESASKTARWTRRPAVYIDTRAHGFDPDTVAMSTWLAELAAEIPVLMTAWSGGVLSPASVTLGDEPPTEGTAGTIVIRVDDNAASYPVPGAMGYAQMVTAPDGTITTAWMRLRFGGLRGDTARGMRRALMAHELGHTLGLGHLDRGGQSVMTPVIVTAGLTSLDTQAGSLVYSRSPGNRSTDVDTRDTIGASVRAAAISTIAWTCDPLITSL